jgi:hypothetical protein
LRYNKNMHLPSDQDIQDRFDDLPQEVRAAIQSADMAAALQEVGQAHQLHLDQLGALEDETLLVMLGFANPAAFTASVKKALGADETTAAAVAEELSEKLFIPIREAMRGYMEARLKRSAQQTTNDQRLTASAPAAARPATNDLQQTTEAAATEPITNNKPLTIAQTEAPVAPTPIPKEGKTILPSAIQPVLHPADEALLTPKITTPAITDVRATSMPSRYSSDPYREPV